MRSLRTGAAAALSLSGIPACAQAAAGIANGAHAAERSVTYSYAGDVAEAARRFGIPETWIWQVMRIESGGDARAVSRAGAMGLMQLMPLTWAALRMQLGLGNDPFNVRDNILAGAAYLRALHDRYGDRAAMLAAYNAGPGRYDDYRSRARPLPPETQAYLAKLAPAMGTAAAIRLTSTVSNAVMPWHAGGLFVRSGSAPSGTNTKLVAHSGGSELAVAESAAPPAPARARSPLWTAAPSQTESLFVRRSGADRSQ